MSDKKLCFRAATVRKKPTDKAICVDKPDKKAIEKAIFIEQIEMFGTLWNRFEDPRGWIWSQENKDV